jgi:hypothetical protein
MTEIKGMKSREQLTPNKQGLNPHLTRSTGIVNKRGRKMDSTLLHPTHHGMDEGW